MNLENLGKLLHESIKMIKVYLKTYLRSFKWWWWWLERQDTARVPLSRVAGQFL